MDMMFRFLLTVAGAFLIGAAVVAISYTVYCKITSGNLPAIIRNALRSSEEQKVKELLAQAIQARVDRVDGNTITISILEEADNAAAQLTITGTEVDTHIREGMKLTA